MKKLVVFYSRTGTTRKLGHKLAKFLKCDFEEIKDTKDRNGALGYLKAGRDATLKKLTVIKPIKKNPDKYDLIIIGTPVWAWTISPAIRTYIHENKNKFKKVAFFCTMGGDGDKKAFSTMQNICNKKPISLLTLRTVEIKDNCEDKIKKFCRDCLALN